MSFSYGICQRLKTLLSRKTAYRQTQLQGRPEVQAELAAVQAEIDELREQGVPILSSAELQRLKDREAVDAGRVDTSTPQGRAHVARVNARRKTDK